MSLNLVNPFMKFASGGGASWSTADTSAMCMGGTNSPWTAGNVVETWNGSSWSAATGLPANRLLLDGGGNSTDGISIGGDSGGTSAPTDDVYTWNGSAWTTHAAALGANTNMLAAGGTSTDAIWMGGSYSSLSTTQTYNGSSWTNVNNMNQGRRGHNGDGNSPDAIVVGGYHDGTSTNLDSSETWDGSAWTYGTNFPNSYPNGQYGYGGGAGHTTNFLAQAQDRAIDNVWIYTGSGWTQTANTTGGSVNYSGLGGDNTNTIKAGGSNGGWNASTSELFDGTSWTATSGLNTGRAAMAMGGNTN